jgi:membrane-associated phospholipid phosphatase
MPSENRKLVRAWPLAAAVAAGLAVCAVNRPVFQMVNGIKWPPLDWVMLSITHLGNGTVAALIILLVTPFRRDLTIRAALAMVMAGVLTSLIKEFFPLPRPPAVFGDAMEVLGVRMMGKSFPSGHTATAFALACSLKGVTDGRVQRAALMLAALVGVSRVYIGAHFPVDVAAGALLGWLSAAATRRPAGSLARSLMGSRPFLDRSLLVLAALCAVYIAFFEPMSRYNPWFLRSLAFAGFGASLFLLTKIPSGEGNRHEP